jgi:hypothetical protein
MKRFMYSIAVVFLLAATPAFAKDIDGPKGSKVKVWAPDGYKMDAVEQNGEALMIAIDPKENAGFIWAAVDAKSVDAATKVLDGIVGKVVKGAKVEKGGAVKLNGIDGLAFKGSGTAIDGGDAVTLSVLILQPTAGKALFVVAMVKTAKKADYKTTFEKVLAGIRKT